MTERDLRTQLVFLWIGLKAQGETIARVIIRYCKKIHASEKTPLISAGQSLGRIIKGRNNFSLIWHQPERQLRKAQSPFTSNTCVHEPCARDDLIWLVDLRWFVSFAFEFAECL